MSEQSTPSSATAPFDRRLLVRRRSRALAEVEAGRARQATFLLERVAQDLVDRLAAVRREFATVLVLGAYAGATGRIVRAALPRALVIETELCEPVARRCGGPVVVADEEALPFRDGSFDLVVSALSLQMVNDLPGVLAQCRRALKPDGLLLAAITGGRTLAELREALLVAEAELTGGAAPRVAPVADVRDLGALLQRTGFALPVADSDVVTVTYDSPLEVLRDLRAMAATSVLVDRPRRPLRRDVLMRALAIYTERFALPGGRVPATFEILTLTGWVPHESQQKPLQPGSASARLADALGVTEGKLGR
ncbi:MAG: methyltransferase domain-containing protein [Hyphomicrobiaceae bacterium]